MEIDDTEVGLHRDTLEGRIERVQMLPHDGEDVNAQDEIFGTPLRPSAITRNTGIGRLLLDSSADVNFQNDRSSQSFLLTATLSGSIRMVRMLLDHGADVNTEANGETALHVAASGGSIEMVQMLLDKGANVDALADGYGTALQLAVSQCNKDMARVLLHNGANVDAQGGLDRTALHIAASGGHKDIIRLLLSNGADINAQEGSYGRTPLHLAVEAKFTSTIAELLEQGAITHKQDFNDATPLELALQKRNHEAVTLLIPKSTDSLCLIKASMWREFFSGPRPHSAWHLEMATGTSATVVQILESEIIKRSYPLSQMVSEFPASYDHFMETDIGSRRIL